MTNDEHLAKFGRSLTVDHVDNQGRYSTTKNHDMENLQTLCLPCHGSKDGMLQPRKLLQSQVDEIRTRYAHRDITQAQLAREYGIAQSMVSAIVRYEWWKPKEG